MYICIYIYIYIYNLQCWREDSRGRCLRAAVGAAGAHVAGATDRHDAAAAGYGGHAPQPSHLFGATRRQPPSGAASRQGEQKRVTKRRGGGRLLWAGGRHLVGPPPADQQALSASDGSGGHF